MSSYKKRLIFLTLDPLNPVIKKLIESLSEDFKIIVVSDIHLDSSYQCESIYYKHRPTFTEKFLLLFYRPNESIAEKEFMQRNVYRKYRFIINILFLLKKLFHKLFYLPTYSEINNFLYKNKTVDNGIITPNDICVVDSNLRHTLTINPMVVRASKVTKLISIVYSWDNPQYSTINTFSNAYLVINEPNKQEIQKYHNIDSKKIFITGSLIHDYLIEHGLPRSPIDKKNLRKPEDPLRILYAAVFGNIDEIMIKEEVKFLVKLSDKLNKKNIQHELIFRPYPSIANPSLYDPLKKILNITLHEHKNYKTIPRLGNKSERISFSKNDEKIDQFFDVDVLISSGSTYTLEFSFSDRPIIHLNANGFLGTIDSSLFFERLAIYGHLNHLSPSNYDRNVVNSFDEICSSLTDLDQLNKSEYNNYLREFSNPFYENKTLARDNIVDYVKNNNE